MVDGAGVSVDQEKVRIISAFRKEDLMDGDAWTQVQQKVTSFLALVMYYQHFISGCSSIAKPFYALIAGQKRSAKSCDGWVVFKN